jgi:hypothetical protein
MMMWLVPSRENDHIRQKEQVNNWSLATWKQGFVATGQLTQPVPLGVI